MQSKPLRQAIDLSLDVLGMRGEVTRREVAQHVLRSTTDNDWSVGDEQEARLSYIQTEVAVRMNEPHSDQFIDQYLIHVPDKFRSILRGLPRFICVSPRGGREAKHVMTFRATKDQWAANFELKDRIVEATTVSRDESRVVHDLLAANGADSLLELLQREAA